MTKTGAVKKSSSILLAPLALLVAVALCAPVGWVLPASADSQVPRAPDGPAVQYQFQVLHGFGANGDGVAAGGYLVMDSKGNLYGVTAGGGTYNGGTVYELTPGATGQWTETILKSFPMGDPLDGYNPVDGVVMDDTGNLYGVTEFGGTNDYGIAYELSPGSGGLWTETILYNFCSQPYCADGAYPLFRPTLGPGGVLYGIGTPVYQLVPGSGGWTFTVIYSFCDPGPNCTTGANPSSGLTLDAKGNLYGETAVGGECSINRLGCGVAYVLHQQSNGQWAEFDLHEFQMESAEDGGTPNGGLTFYGGGLFGVAFEGGSNCLKIGGCGVTFELTEGSGKHINETIIWNFGGNGGAQGVGPSQGVTFDKRGDIFGVTPAGGEGCGGGGCGVAYGMRQQKSGQWAYQVLRTFDGSDGVEPDGVLTIDNKGNLYGTTGGGGPNGGGEVFELSPTAQASK